MIYPTKRIYPLCIWDHLWAWPNFQEFPFSGARVLSQAGTAYVTYENCIVPKKYLIGTENKGRIDHSHEDFK